MTIKYNLIPALLVVLLITFTIPWESNASELHTKNSEIKLSDGQFYKTLKKDQGHKHLAGSQSQYNQAQINDCRILVKLKKNEQLPVDTFGIELVEHTSHDNDIIIMRIPKEKSFAETLHAIKQNPRVEMAAPDYIRELSYIPKDPGYQKQWYLPKIKMPEAWELEKGSEKITVAVLDSGVNAQHNDLQGRILPGYDFQNEDNNPADDNGHGTFVTGIIAANSNDIGTTGIDLNTKILPVKVSNEQGEITSSNIEKGIRYAMKQGADVINMSFSSTQYNELEYDAILDAYEVGITLVAAAGNHKSNLIEYPAGYPEVISVSAVDRDDRLSWFSNVGGHIDLTAPGEGIYSTAYKGGVAIGDGTSFSAPIVSGLASLLRSIHADWTNPQIEWAMESAAKSFENAEWDESHGYGRVNAAAALRKSLPSLQNDAADTLEKATELAYFTETKQHMDLPGDMDWYRVKVDKAAKLTISLSTEAKLLDLGIIVNPPSKQQFVVDRNGLGEGEEYTLQAKEGTYYVGFFDFNNRWSASSYTVKVEKSVYKDVYQYEKEISYLTDKDIIQGYPDNTFKPKKNITRLQAVQMILKQKGIDWEKTNPKNPHFTDVQPDRYGYNAVEKAAELGIITGKEDGTFQPSSSLTRAQMAAIMVKAFNLTGDYDGEFNDVPKGFWAYDVINTLAANKISRGYPDNMYQPNENISREHFSLFMYNYLTRQL